MRSAGVRSGGGVGWGGVGARGGGLVAPCSSIPAVVGRWPGNGLYICSQPQTNGNEV